MNIGSGLAGVLPILVTPFDDEGRVDEESLRSLVEFFIERGCHGLTVLGIAGEVHKLSDAERRSPLRPSSPPFGNFRPTGSAFSAALGGFIFTRNSAGVPGES